MDEYHQQIQNAVGIILRHVKTPSDRICLNKNNILTCFNLQINLDSHCISEFNFNSKLRVIVYLYSKFFNRIKICHKMEDFFHFVNLKTQQDTFDFLLNRYLHLSNKSDFRPTELGQSTNDQVDLLSSFFSATTKFSGETRELVNQKANFILKKLLIQMVTVLDIMKLYINFNLQRSFFGPQKFASSAEILNTNSTIIQEIFALKNSHATQIFPPDKRFRICKHLLRKSLCELAALVNVADVSTYVLLTNVYMSGKENLRRVRLFTGESFSVNVKVNEEVLFYKSKRKDELVKFSFKFIRKQLINRHRRKISKNASKVKAQFVRKHFNQEILGNDPQVVEYFYSMEVNKKNLKSLAKAPQVIEMVNKYKEKHFLQDQINFNIFQKNENIFREDVSLLEFIKKIFIVQNKNNVTLQSVLNSLYVFDGFFKF